MSSPIEKPAPAAIPQLKITTTPSPKYSINGSVTVAEEKTNLTRESTLSTPGCHQTADPFGTDIEAMITPSHLDNCPRKSMNCQRPDAECQVWPGKEHWKRKAKAARVNRSWCGCMAKMSKRNRIIVQLLIFTLIVGIAVAVGFGISKPLGAPIPNVAGQK